MCTSLPTAMWSLVTGEGQASITLLVGAAVLQLTWQSWFEFSALQCAPPGTLKHVYGSLGFTCVFYGCALQGGDCGGHPTARQLGRSRGGVSGVGPRRCLDGGSAVACWPSQLQGDLGRLHQFLLAMQDCLPGSSSLRRWALHPCFPTIIPPPACPSSLPWPRW